MFVFFQRSKLKNVNSLIYPHPTTIFEEAFHSFHFSFCTIVGGFCPNPLTGSAFEVGNMCFVQAREGEAKDNAYYCGTDVQAPYVAFMSQPLSQEVMDGLTSDLGMPLEVWTPFERKLDHSWTALGKLFKPCFCGN